jgi:hypothetical protein
VLEHFCKVPAPIQLLPLIVPFFDDTTPLWGKSTIQAQLRDAAFMAFEKAVGLQLGFGRLHANRVRHRDAIREILEDWRRRHP